ncbi:hypothetical protein XALC_2515 [Xanthomonas albilineans GPE PC73]|uniref:Secreted protein n=1 Tax=Xanthomonas albilineans (strain GPE PC73 / CFBP 7063) TaxID=380358 RepID=D2U9P2_XANAP|nr:hypothetical protein XALC_2515 [Xanthomonas albilineans GPE PC73]
MKCLPLLCVVLAVWVTTLGVVYAAPAPGAALEGKVTRAPDTLKPSDVMAMQQRLLDWAQLQRYRADTPPWQRRPWGRGEWCSMATPSPMHGGAGKGHTFSPVNPATSTGVSPGRPPHKCWCTCVRT